MGLFDSIVRIAAAPVEIVDKTVAKPLADLSEETLRALGIHDDRRR